MSEGLIQRLVGFLEAYLAALGAEHRCYSRPATAPGQEEEQFDEASCGSCEGSPSEERSGEHIEQQAISDSVEDSEPATSGGSESRAAASDGANVSQELSASASVAGPVFRITSPSYQAVQYELEQFFQLRESHAAASASADVAAASAYIPGSPRSICLSPDRSPLSLSCGYSPDRSPPSSGAVSPVYSPSPSVFDGSRTGSPPGSPRTTAYSPILMAREEETFSDELNSGMFARC